MKKFLLSATLLAISVSPALADTTVSGYPITIIQADNTDDSTPCMYVAVNGTNYAALIDASGKNRFLMDVAHAARLSGIDVTLHYNGTVVCYEGTFSKITNLYY